MLKTLTVWNFALIEYAQVEFSTGLNILTGETGAGKSILIDSVGVILGSRASVDSIRNGCDWLRAEAVFDIAGEAEISAFLTENGILEDADALIVSRQISRSGKNMIRVNGCQITLAILKALGGLLIDIHGQHENQALLRPENQLALLDLFRPETKDRLAAYQSQFRVWRALAEKLAKTEADSRVSAQRIDMLKWQTDEIAAADLKDNEDEALEAQIKVLSNAEKISISMQHAYALLENGGKGIGGILPSLAEVKKNLEVAVRYDDKLSGVLAILEESTCQLQECSYEIRDYGEAIDYSPENLDRLQARMDVIYKLRKKYGATIEAVLAHYEQAKAELTEIENYDVHIIAMKEELEKARQSLDEVAASLTAARRLAAQELSAAIRAHLLSLGMPDAEFRIEVLPLVKIAANGADEVRMMFSANLGETPKPLQKVASGGELSRIALAIKAVCAAREKVGVMIFDEIDTGIGGKTAQMVAERIAMVAAHKQVLCITHLPQIACMADSHLYIDKKVRENQTVTLIKRLSASEQLNELARMFSGMNVTSASLDNAMEMRNNAALKKKQWRPRT